MARVDKTESAIGVCRAPSNAKIEDADFNKVIGVGLNGQGRVVKGAGTSGIIGVICPTRIARNEGSILDIFQLAQFVEVDGIGAGAKVYASNTTGELSTTAEGGTPVGFTVEADRLCVRF